MRTIDIDDKYVKPGDSDIFGKISRSRTEIMGLAAIWIYYFHVGQPVSSDMPVMSALLWYLHRVGFIGVDIFLIISGYGLYYSMTEHPVRDCHDYAYFIKRRFIRLWKAYIPVTLLFAVKDRWGIGVLILRILGIEQFIKGIYDYLWFIPCIYIFYILAPFIFIIVNKISKTRLRLVFPAAICASVYIFCIASVPFMRSDLYGLITRIPSFFTGMFFAELSKRRLPAHKAHLTAGIYIAAAVVSMYWSYKLNLPSASLMFEAENAFANQLMAPGLVLVLAVLLTGLSAATGCAAQCLDRVLCIFGMISLEFYCLQERIWEGMQGLKMPYALQQILCLILTLMLAAAVHRITGKIKKRPAIAV